MCKTSFVSICFNTKSGKKNTLKTRRLWAKNSFNWRYLENIFGDFIGFFIIWGYWISILLVNASIAIAITSYLSVFTDIIQKREFAILISILIVLVIAFINYNGIKNTGNFQFKKNCKEKILNFFGYLNELNSVENLARYWSTGTDEQIRAIVHETVDVD